VIEYIFSKSSFNDISVPIFFYIKYSKFFIKIFFSRVFQFFQKFNTFVNLYFCGKQSFRFKILRIFIIFGFLIIATSYRIIFVGYFINISEFQYLQFADCRDSTHVDDFQAAHIF